MLTETDDFFCHQMVAPHVRVLHNDPSWAERAYFPVSDPDRFALDVGVSLFPNGDVLEAYAIATVPDGPQWSLRASRDLAGGRWPLAVTPFRFDVLDPLTKWRLRTEPNPSGIEFDLVYEARCDAFETSSPTIHRRNRLVYQNVNLLQTGRYSGEVTIEGRRIVLCHYAMRAWPGQHKGALQLYGHSHGKLPGTPQSTDVGVDCWGFQPIRLDHIRVRLRQGRP